MSSTLEKSMAILESLAVHPGGRQVSALAEALDQPVSGVHRQLRELERLGYVRQLRSQGEYALTIRLAAMGLGFLGRSGIKDVAQPVLDSLAEATGELIRLSVREGHDLTWVAVAQGARGGLLYDPGSEHGLTAHLPSTATGLAYMSTLPEDEALLLIGRQGVRRADGPVAVNAPSSVAEVMEGVRAARARGYSLAIDTYIDGMAAMAVPVRHGLTGEVLGCLSIAGPSVRLQADRLDETARVLAAHAGELGALADGSDFFALAGRRTEPADTGAPRSALR